MIYGQPCCTQRKQHSTSTRNRLFGCIASFISKLVFIFGVLRHILYGTPCRCVAGEGDGRTALAEPRHALLSNPSWQSRTYPQQFGHPFGCCQQQGFASSNQNPAPKKTESTSKELRRTSTELADGRTCGDQIIVFKRKAARVPRIPTKPTR